jgi:hypothetical protein
LATENEREIDSPPPPPHISNILSQGRRVGGGGEKVKGKNGEMLSRGPLVGYTTSRSLGPNIHSTHLYLCRRRQSKGIEVRNTKTVCCTFQFTHQNTFKTLKVKLLEEDILSSVILFGYNPPPPSYTHTATAFSLSLLLSV